MHFQEGVEERKEGVFVHVCVCARGENTLTCCVKVKAVVLTYISASSGGHVAAYVGRRVCECVHAVHYR